MKTFLQTAGKSAFSLVMGWATWGMIMTLSFIKHGGTSNSFDDLVVILAIGLIGAWLNLKWSNRIGDHEPALQVTLLVSFVAIYVVPYIFQPLVLKGMTDQDYALLAVFLLVMVGARIVYREFLTPIARVLGVV